MNLRTGALEHVEICTAELQPPEAVRFYTALHYLALSAWERKLYCNRNPTTLGSIHTHSHTDTLTDTLDL